MERLTERHIEALTQSVELIAAENQQRDRRLNEMEGIASLLHVAEIRAGQAPSNPPDPQRF